MTSRLALHGVSKRYGTVQANEHISLELAEGELHGILGENGAGKSTLMKIIYGAVRPDAGELYWQGRRIDLKSPRQARALGIGMVFQHFALFDSLTVAENVWLGLDRSLSLPQVRERMRSLAREYGLQLEAERPVHSLSVGERQRVEIVRALMAEPRLLILDEPTSVLTPEAAARLGRTLQQLAERGCSVLYISHKLQEVRSLCQRCTVLRAGRVVAEVTPAEQTTDSLARLMLGALPARLEVQESANVGPREIALRVDALSLPTEGSYGVVLDELSFELRAGEILGLAGVSGSGQGELLSALSGEDLRARRGSITLFGEDVSALPPAARRRRGLRFLPEERLGRATVPGLSLAQNTLLTRTESVASSSLIARAALHAQTAALLARHRVKASGVHAEARSLSGGNLQKFIVGRELDAAPRVLVVAQPTWGVDVGAAAQIRAELLALRARGAAILLVSEDLEELLSLSTRVMVMAKGRLSPAIARAEATIERIGTWMGSHDA